VGNERAPWAKRRSEQRKRDAALRYDLEMEFRKVGWGDPALVYDEDKDLFQLPKASLKATHPKRPSRALGAMPGP
jgi:hypothetical protein